MNPYEAKQEARRERLEARAERLGKEASAAFKRADLREEVSGIPFGQPILVGHHSEGRHRAAIARADRAMRKGVELSKAAEAAASRAAGIGSGGISSDDPDAVVKLKEKLAGLEADQAQMVAANKVIKAFWKAGVRGAENGEPWDRYMDALRKINPAFSASSAKRLIDPHERWMGVGYPSYSLSNNSANIRRVKDRIKDLERKDFDAPSVVKELPGDVRLVESPEDNRLQLFFPGKPQPPVIQALKAHGFRWAPSVGAWQRHLSNAARWAAEEVLKKVAAE